MTRDDDDRKQDPIDRRDFLTRMGGAAAALVGASTVTGMFDQLDTVTASAAQKVLGVGQPDLLAPEAEQPHGLRAALFIV